MKVLNNYQTINDKDGKPVFVVIPYTDFVHFQGYVPKDGVPHAVVSKAIAGMSMLQSWREYLADSSGNGKAHEHNASWVCTNRIIKKTV